MKNFLALSILLLVPQLVLAVWWNPLTWFNKHESQEQITENVWENKNMPDQGIFIEDRASENIESKLYQDEAATLFAQIGVLESRIKQLELKLDKARIEIDSLKQNNNLLKLQVMAQTIPSESINQQTQQINSQVLENASQGDTQKIVIEERYDKDVEKIKNQLEELHANYMKQNDFASICAARNDWQEYIKYNAYNKENYETEALMLNQKYGINLSENFYRAGLFNPPYCSMTMFIGHNSEAGVLADWIRVLENENEKEKEAQ